jgi:hypothetical protein
LLRDAWPFNRQVLPMLDFPRAGVRFLPSAPALCALVFLATGCDPEGPGASGTITISNNVKREGLTRLRLRAVVRPHDAFTANAPKFPRADAQSLSTNIQLDELQTSVHYDFGEVLGTTPHHRWRLFAWLEQGDSEEDFAAGSTQPPHGAPYGEADFAVDSCGVGGDYCGHKGGVDLAIDKVAP